MGTLRQPAERGQAIVLIALGMVILLAFLALAVDGGNLYLHRRVAQNASDAGALNGAARMLEVGVTEAQILSTVYAAATRNGIDPAQPDNALHVWYVNAQGARLSDVEVGSWGFVPIGQGAAGIEVQAETNFTAFVAQIVGHESLSAQSDSGAVVTFPGFYTRWAFYANCDKGNTKCYNNAFNISGSDTLVTGGGIHSNSGLHTTGSVYVQDPQLAEWGTPGICTGDACPFARQVAPRPMPVLYRWEDFQPGGYWWNDMCAGGFEEKYCHYVEGDIAANDVISGGLWVVTGDIKSPRFFNPAQTHYTFVAQGNIAFNSAMPAWEHFAGSSAQGGSKAFMISFAADPQGASMTSSFIQWDGIIYAPYGLATVSASETVTGDVGIYAWRIDLSGSKIRLHHTPSQLPPEQGSIILLW